MATTGKDREMAAARIFADMEANRLDKMVRQRYGEPAYAKELGSSLVTHLLALHVSGVEESIEATLAMLGKRIEQIAKNPELSTNIVEGVLHELEERRLTPKK